MNRVHKSEHYCHLSCHILFLAWLKYRVFLGFFFFFFKCVQYFQFRVVVKCRQRVLINEIRHLKNAKNNSLPYPLFLKLFDVVVLDTVYLMKFSLHLAWWRPALLSQLSHWGRDKMAAIIQTTFWNGFSSMKMYEYRLKFHWSLFLRVKLTIFRHWFR